MCDCCKRDCNECNNSKVSRAKGVIDWAKPIQTRDGRPARLLGTLIGQEYAYAVAVMTNGEESIWYRRQNGRCFIEVERDDPHDIINVPPKMKTLSGHVILIKGKDGKWRPAYDDILISKDGIDSITNYYDRYTQEYKILPISFEVPDES